MFSVDFLANIVDARTANILILYQLGMKKTKRNAPTDPKEPPGRLIQPEFWSAVSFGNRRKLTLWLLLSLQPS